MLACAARWQRAGAAAPPGMRAMPRPGLTRLGCAGAQAFAQTLQQSRGFGSEFRFPDRPAPATAPAGEAAAAAATAPGFAGANGADDDDDLYN